jgi:hypothetical protein
MPFLFAHAAGADGAPVPDELRTLVADHGFKALMVDFAPQEVVLSHEAVGFFLVRFNNVLARRMFLTRRRVIWVATPSGNRSLLGNR